MDFYSRASCEARLDVDGFYNFVDSISTHAPRVRRDYPPQFFHLNCIDFYSRASCEARPLRGAAVIAVNDFYSRASCEARRKKPEEAGGAENFYSRASCEARRSVW